MADAGAAVMIRQSELTAEKLFGVVKDLLDDGRRLREMEQKSKALGRPDAAAAVVDACLKLVQQNGR